MEWFPQTFAGYVVRGPDLQLGHQPQAPLILGSVQPVIQCSPHRAACDRAPARAFPSIRKGVGQTGQILREMEALYVN